MQLLRFEPPVGDGLIDITDTLEGVVTQSGLKDGVLTVQTPNNSCAVVALSSEFGTAEKPFLDSLNRLIPLQDGWNFRGYTVRAVRSALLGTSKSVIIAGGRLLRGAFERFYIVSFSTDVPVLLMAAVSADCGEPLSDTRAVEALNDAIAEKKARQREEEARAVQEMRAEWAAAHGAQQD